MEHLLLRFPFTHHGPYFIVYQLEISNSDLENSSHKHIIYNLCATMTCNANPASILFLTCFFSELLVLSEICWISIADGIDRTFRTSIRNGRPDPSIRTCVCETFSIPFTNRHSSKLQHYIDIFSSSSMELVAITSGDGTDTLFNYLLQKRCNDVQLCWVGT